MRERRAARELCRAVADRRAIKAKGFVAQVKLTNRFPLRSIDGMSGRQMCVTHPLNRIT